MSTTAAPVTPDPAAATTPASTASTTIGAVIDAAKSALSAFTGVFKDMAGLVGNIARLDKAGEEQLVKISEKGMAAGAADFKTYLSSIFADAAADKSLDLTIGNSKLKMASKGSYTTSGGASGLFEAVEAYAFAKSIFTNPALVKDGLHLQILNDGGATAKKPEDYTEADLKNLAMCYAAVKDSGLTVKNEAQLLAETFKDKDAYIAEAKTAYETFKAVKEMADSPGFKGAKEALDQVTVEAMKAAEEAPVVATVEEKPAAAAA
jgi:hypothetical protein